MSIFLKIELAKVDLSQCFSCKGIRLDMVGVGQQYLRSKIIFKERLSLMPRSRKKCGAKGSFLLYICTYGINHSCVIFQSLPAAVRKSIYLGLHWKWVSKLHCITVIKDIYFYSLKMEGCNATAVTHTSIFLYHCNDI